MGIEASEKHILLWDKEKNGPIPNGLGLFNQNKKYWWKCECGHEWQTSCFAINKKINAKCKQCISRKRHEYTDLSGKIFGYWRVLYKQKTTNRRGIYWLCECKSCGNKKELREDNLELGQTHKCLKCHKSITRKNFPIASSHWRSIECAAKERKIDFDIGIDYIVELFWKQGGKCALTGDDLCLYTDNKGYHLYGPKLDNYASLDRIDSSKGYIVGNLQWVRKDINMLKGALSQDKLIELCKKVSNNFKG